MARYTYTKRERERELKEGSASAGYHITLHLHKEVVFLSLFLFFRFIFKRYDDDDEGHPQSPFSSIDRDNGVYRVTAFPSFGETNKKQKKNPEKVISPPKPVMPEKHTTCCGVVLCSHNKK